MKKLENFILKQDLWLYLMVPIVIFLIGMTDMARDPQEISWSRFFSGTGILLMYQLPVLLFVWYKPKLKVLLSGRKYIALWIAALILYPLFSLLLEMGLLLGDEALKFRKYYEGEIMNISIAVTICLSLALKANAYFSKNRYLFSGYKKLE